MKILIAILCLAIIATGAQALPAPRLHIASLAELPVVIRAPYDGKANADRDVATAFDRARTEHKRILIDLGGNWCPDCILLANVMALPEMKAFLAAHFVIVKVDVGRFDRNLQVPARFGITRRLEGVPSVIIAEPDGRFVNRGDISALSDARHLTPSAIAGWLAQWAR